VVILFFCPIIVNSIAVEKEKILILQDLVSFSLISITTILVFYSVGLLVVKLIGLGNSDIFSFLI